MRAGAARRREAIYFFFVFLVCYNESCLLLAGGESPRLPDSLHISAAVEEDMAVVILLSGRWEGLDTHTHTHTHILIW